MTEAQGDNYENVSKVRLENEVFLALKNKDDNMKRKRVIEDKGFMGEAKHGGRK